MSGKCTVGKLSNELNEGSRVLSVESRFKSGRKSRRYSFECITDSANIPSLKLPVPRSFPPTSNSKIETVFWFAGGWSDDLVTG